MKKASIPKKGIPKEGPFIAWNSEKSEEMYMEDYLTDYNVLIKFRNVDDIAKKIGDKFTEQSFRSPVDITEKMRGHIPNTVNDYLLVTYSVYRNPETFDLGWTGMSVVKDPNLSKHHRKYKTIEEYVENLMKCQQD